MYITGLAIPPYDSLTLYVTYDRGLVISSDGGRSWQDVEAGLQIECFSKQLKCTNPVICNGPQAVVASPSSTGPVVAVTGNGQFDFSNTTAGVVFLDATDGMWYPFYPDEGVAGGADLVMAPDGGTVYVALFGEGIATLHLDKLRMPEGRLP